MAIPTLTKTIELARAWLADHDGVDDFDSDLYVAYLEDAYCILKAVTDQHRNG